MSPTWVHYRGVMLWRKGRRWHFRLTEELHHSVWPAAGREQEKHYGYYVGMGTAMRKVDALYRQRVLVEQITAPTMAVEKATPALTPEVLPPLPPMPAPLRTLLGTLRLLRRP